MGKPITYFYNYIGKALSILKLWRLIPIVFVAFLFIHSSYAQIKPGLPVEDPNKELEQFVSASATCDNGQVLVKWSIRHWQPSGVYIVERKGENCVFEVIGMIASKIGKKGEDINYTFIDINPAGDEHSFYRIRRYKSVNETTDDMQSSMDFDIQLTLICNRKDKALKSPLAY